MCSVLLILFFSDVLKLLLQYGAYVNQTDKAHYKTGLHVACEAQSVACVQYLLDAGADPNVQAERGRTALHIGMTDFLLFLVIQKYIFFRSYTCISSSSLSFVQHF